MLNTGLYYNNPILCNVYDNTGSCRMNGFLDINGMNYSFDSKGVLEFSTKKEFDSEVYFSTGALLSDSLLVMQKQENKCSFDNPFYQIYSWNPDGNKYTYLLFSDEDAMKMCYDKLKAADKSLCGGSVDISEIFNQLDIPFDYVANTLVNQSYDSGATESLESKTSFGGK